MDNLDDEWVYEVKNGICRLRGGYRLKKSRDVDLNEVSKCS
jgi:hypothetical protein